MSTVDPVFQASEYQQMLLGHLGHDDPAEVQRGTVAAWRSLVSDAGTDLRTRPADGEWSVVELLGHAADAELVCSGRYRWIATHDEPPILGYDQDLWVSGLHHQGADPDELLDLFDALRQANLALWARSTPEIRARIGIHQERGPESFDLTFRLLAGHDRFHLDQARRTLEQVRAKPA
jgi:DinB superfamily